MTGARRRFETLGIGPRSSVLGHEMSRTPRPKAASVGVGADSVIDVKGNGWLIDDNIGDNAEEGFQTHRVMDGWGTDNVFRRPAKQPRM